MYLIIICNYLQNYISSDVHFRNMLIIKKIINFTCSSIETLDIPYTIYIVGLTKYNIVIIVLENIVS